MGNGEKNGATLYSLLIPAAASVLIAALTTYGTIAAGSGKLDRATASAEETLTKVQQAKRALSPVPVGSVIASTLTPAEFAEAAGDPTVFDPARSKWALADGRQVVGSEFHALSNGQSIVDLRAMFLRGVNSGRADSFRDPDGDRQGGTSQAWSTGAPRQSLAASPDGTHVHNGPGGNVGFVGGGSGQHSSGSHAGPAYGASAMTPAGLHTHAISGGDAETRPNNVGVNFYVRINP